MLKALHDVPAFMNMQWITTLATVDKRGKLHAVPVWFTFDDGKLNVQIDRKSLKVRNIRFNHHCQLLSTTCAIKL